MTIFKIEVVLSPFMHIPISWRLVFLGVKVKTNKQANEKTRRFWILIKFIFVYLENDPLPTTEIKNLKRSIRSKAKCGHT